MNEWEELRELTESLYLFCFCEIGVKSEDHPSSSRKLCWNGGAGGGGDQVCKQGLRQSFSTMALLRFWTR